jgi:hypothetical protein
MQDSPGSSPDASRFLDWRHQFSVPFTTKKHLDNVPLENLDFLGI